MEYDFASSCFASRLQVQSGLIVLSWNKSWSKCLNLWSWRWLTFTCSHKLLSLRFKITLIAASTAWKMSVFGVILVCIFPHSDWIRGATPWSLRIQSECRKMWTRFTPNSDTFYAVQVNVLLGSFFRNKHIPVFSWCLIFAFANVLFSGHFFNVVFSRNIYLTVNLLPFHIVYSAQELILQSSNKI